MQILGGKKTIIGSFPFFNNVIQIAGFVPLTSCTAEECRQYDSLCGDCYLNVFGENNNTASDNYKNDKSFFLVSMPLVAPQPVFVLEKFNSALCLWQTSATLNDGTYGEYFPLNFFTSHKRYTGYLIYWNKVFFQKGKGTYRFKINSVIKGRQQCALSEPFCLQLWNCDLAHGTVKFEVNISGKIGSIDDYYRVFDLCGMTYYDAVRVGGFFGYEKTEYGETLLEHQNGLIQRIRDEAIQNFEFRSHLLRKWIHDRLKTYGFMADTILVSDYNRNNSDYSINRKSVIKSGGYEPEYLDKETKRRLSKVVVKFKEGVQSVIKSSCCDNVVQVIYYP
jgi:hypothetical protein